MRSVGIVIPAYRPNTELLCGYIEALIETINPETIRVELDDPTAETARALASTDATVSTTERRRGKGAALTAGFDALTTDIRGFVDADGATPADAFTQLIETVSTDKADIAVASRRHPDAVIETGQSRVRESLGDGFAWLARRLLDVSLSDYQCGAKAITAEGWRTVRNQMDEDGFAWDIELVAFGDAAGLRIKECPIQWHDRSESTVPPVRTAVTLATALVRTRYRARALRRDVERNPAGRTVAAGHGVERKEE